MTLWLNLVLAWIAVALAVLLIIIWALRLIYKKKKLPWIKSVNCTLRKHHKVIGLFMIFSALIHGLLSSEILFSLNWGTAIFVICILLALSWMLRKLLNLKKWWMYIHRILTVSFAALLVIHIINVGGIMIDDLITGKLSPPSVAAVQTIALYDSNSTDAAYETPMPSNTTTPTALPTLPPKHNSAKSTEAPTDTPTAVTTDAPTAVTTEMPAAQTQIYNDGVYTGTGVGYRPGLVVEVVIENDVIISVTVIEHNEKNEQFWGVPVQLVPQLIVDAQSTDVDIVSGATYTSIGIMEAVNDALEQALK